MKFRIVLYISSKIASFWIKYKYNNIGKNFKTITPTTFSVPADKVNIGDDFFAGSGLYISLSEYSPLYIGHAVMFGPEVMVLGGNHNYKYTGGHLRYNYVDDINAEKIVIEDGVWVGARSMFLSGAFVCEGAVIGAGSLVNKYIPPYVLAVGSPSRILGCRYENVADLSAVLDKVGSKYKLNQILDIYKIYGVTLC
ncbi:acyltransferase [Oceanospirillaceae bacterium]|nr:acyltransferase [Oceanospirillaceae bacterium]